MESGPSNTLLYCLSISFGGALVAFASGASSGLELDKDNVLLFFVWVTFILWFIAILPLVTKLLRSKR